MHQRLLTISLALLLAPTAMAAAPESPRTPERADGQRAESRSKPSGGSASRAKRPAKRGPSAPGGGPTSKPAPAPSRPDSAPRQPTSGGASSGGAPQGQRPEGERPSGERPSGERPDGSRPDGHVPSGPSSGARPGPAGGPDARPAAPPNYRPASRPPGNGGHVPANSPQAQAHSRAQATARAHHQAARGGYHPSNHPSRAEAHARAQAHHQAWNARHHRPWYKRPAVVVWHPGYPRHWYHGVFVYGPGPRYHGRAHVPASAAPKREVDRAGDWAIGVRGGSYMSGYKNGASYGDFGMGLALRYRPVEALGLEAQWVYHDQTWDSSTERISQPLSASVQLFAAPWSRFNPYFLTGVTHTGVNFDDQLGKDSVEAEGGLWGPHLGVGLEFGLGERASINFDLRGIGYLNAPREGLLANGAAQANMGVNFYF